MSFMDSLQVGTHSTLPRTVATFLRTKATAVQQMRQVLASQLKQTLRRAGSRSHGSHGRGALKCGADVYQ